MLKNVLYVAPCEREEFVSRVNGDESRPLRAVKVGANDDDDEDHDDAMMRDFSLSTKSDLSKSYAKAKGELPMGGELWRAMYEWENSPRKWFQI